MAQWWKKENMIPLADKNFQTILRFYLFECPVVMPITSKGEKIKKLVSQRGKTLEQYGWSGKGLNTLLSAMKRAASSSMQYIVVGPKEDVVARVNSAEAESKFSNKEYEIIAFQENEKLGKTRSIFYMIRNAFAHGSFSVVQQTNKRIYYFQSEKDGEIKSQLRLSEDTLLKWIDLIGQTASELSRKKNKEKVLV